MTVEQAREYRGRCLHYLSNAAHMLRDHEPEKASELVWGAFVQALKALASLKDLKLRNHREIRRYARDAAKELGNERIFELYGLAETLHSNFYEGMFDAGQVIYISQQIREMIASLLELLPE